jgi:formylglycine-generating enzyme required for sulfatase activity
MRLRFTVLFGLMLALMVTVSQGELRMRVHRGGQAEEFVVSEIDSLTFYEHVTVPTGFVSLPAGTFTMGSPEDEPERSEYEVQHTVTLTTPFEMFATEVTNRHYADLAQWAYDHGYCTATSLSLLDALGGSTQELLDLDGGDCEISFSGGMFTVDTGKEDNPVLGVTWYGSVAYCDWLSLEAGLTRAYDHSTWSCNGNDPYNAVGYRLPTEAEWEYACRAGTQTPFNTGNCLDAGTEANYRGTPPYVGCPSGPSADWTVPVGSYPANTFGLYDMHGNVYEWCNDWYWFAYGGDETDPTGPGAGSYRVIRSGKWSYYAHGCRSAFRYYVIPHSSSPYFGFRPARSTN